MTVDSNASFQSTVSHGLQTPGRGLAGLRASSRPAADIVPQTPGRGLAGLRASSSAVTDVGDPSEGEPTVFNPRPRVNTTVSAPFGLTTESQIQAAYPGVPASTRERADVETSRARLRAAPCDACRGHGAAPSRQ